MGRSLLHEADRLDTYIHARVKKQTKEEVIRIAQAKNIRSLSALVQGLLEWWLDNNRLMLEEEKSSTKTEVAVAQ